MKQTKKEIIREKLKEKNYEIGCYHYLIDKLNKNYFSNLLLALDEEATDLDVKIRNREYVIEIETIDNEKDFNIITKEEYISRYGDERYDEE